MSLGGCEKSMASEDQIEKWWNQNYEGSPKPEEQEQQREEEKETIDPKIKEAVDFSLNYFWGDCAYDFLGLRCLSVRSLMEKFSVNENDQDLLIKLLLEKLNNYHKFDHGKKGPLLMPILPRV